VTHGPVAEQTLCTQEYTLPLARRTNNG